MAPSKFLLLSVLTLLIQDISCHNISQHFTELNNTVGVLHEKGVRVVNVDGFRSKGGGVAGDSEAFEKAWNVTCSSSVSAVFMVPENRSYTLKQINFDGPCKSNITFLIKGTLEAPSDRSYWNDTNRRVWIAFNGIKHLRVTGGGIINGNGHVWWQNSCKKNRTLPCVGAPTALTFTSCKHLKVDSLRIRDSQQMHVVIERSKRVRVSKLSISAPEKSPNTDGIHVTRSKNVIIGNCDIRTGDDCVSIVSGSKNIKVHNVFCGPGHGISIGSLGNNNTTAHVSNVVVDTATLNGTTNGVRIKTWQGGRGYAKNIVFQNITMQNVKNPIIITQNYCDSNDPCPEQRDAVAVKHVTYKNIKGTSSSKLSVKFDCSKSVPCRNIRLKDIDLVREDGRISHSMCSNVRWKASGLVVPRLGE